MSPQSSIAHYRITAKLGKGGMGEVWRATDTKLVRDVAIKILPETFAQDPDRLARFTREAQVLASLNHPHIAAIYGVEERALVMELVPGPTLAERIAQGPIPLDEALPIAQQIAEALEYAHERGVIHRDLKPANIKIPPEGRVKVLDFGLARALGNEPASGDPASSPTLTMSPTVAGMILGTAAYMSPEQAKGKPVDKRADIWAFAAVLAEMLTGKPLYSGETISDTLAAVIMKEPDLQRLPAATPTSVRRLLRRCLEKDGQRRLRDIGEARIAIQDTLAGALPEEPAVAPTAPSRNAIAWAVTALMTLAFLTTGVLLWRATRLVDHPLVRLNVDLGPDALTGLSTTVSISPDGRRLVFPARGPDGKQLLATRLVNQSQTTLVTGTVGGQDPFFSPDGEWVGFFAENKLRKISVQGGAPVTLCEAVNPRGGSWGEDGNIVAALNQLSPLSRVPEAGGVPQRLTKLSSGEATHRWPQVLRGGQAILFTTAHTTIGMEDADIAVMAVKSGVTKILHHGAYHGRYLPSGHLVYMHQGLLFGVAFDANRLETRGIPVPLVEEVAGNSVTGGGQLAFSQTGTLVYLAGKGASQSWPLVWLDSSGGIQPLLTSPGVYYHPRISPEGRRLALTEMTKGQEIFVYDIKREAVTRLTFDGRSSLPVWSPDGKYIAFRSNSAPVSISLVRSDGGGESHRLLESRNNMVPSSFSPDGRRLAYYETDPEMGQDLWSLSVDTSDPDHPKAGKPEPFLRTPADERMPIFSPDGHWIAYSSNQSGIQELFVRPFPGPGGKWQISTGGELYAFWSKNGKELFYETPDNRIMVVDYTTNRDSFTVGKPRLWCDRMIFNPGAQNLDLAPDGKHFAVTAAPENVGHEKGSAHVTFLLNFFDELRRRVPVN
jgi:serine/threonine-protein kinase